MTTSQDFIVDHFIAQIPMLRPDALATIAAVAQILVAANAGDRQAELLAELEANACEPAGALVARLAATIGGDEPRAVRLLMAVCGALLAQAERDSGKGLRRASSVAVELRRAATWDRADPDGETSRQESSDSEAGGDQADLPAPDSDNGGGWSFGQQEGPDIRDYGGPHGSGAGPDDSDFKPGGPHGGGGGPG